MKMKKIVLITSAILLILCIFIACDNGVAFVNDIKPLPTSSHTDGEGYNTVIFVTAQDKEKIYDPDDPQGRIEPDPELTYTHVPAELPPGVVFTGNLIRVAGEEAGEYDIKQGSLALAGENAAKYTLVFIGAKLTIYEKGVVTIIAKNKNKFQDEQDPLPFDYFVAPSEESLRMSFGITVVGALERSAGTAPGDYTINQGTLHLEGIDAGDWRIAFTPGVLHIAPEGEILIRAASFEKTYGDPDPELAYTTIPAALPAGLSLSGNFVRTAGNKAGVYNILKGSLVLTGTAEDHKPYHLEFAETAPGVLGTLTINKKAVTVTADSFRRVINADKPTFTYTNNIGLPDSAFTGDLVWENGATMATAGVYAIRQGSLKMSTTTDGAGERYVDNYDLSFKEGTLTVTNDNIIYVSARNASKEYGDRDPTINYAPDEPLPGDLRLTGAPTREPGENVGEYSYQIGTLGLTGTNYQYYTISFVSGSKLTISPRDLTVIPSDDQSKIYGASNPTTYKYSTEPSVNQAEVFGSTKLLRETVRTEGGESEGGEAAGHYKFDFSNLKLQGDNAQNYNLLFDNSKTFEIKQRPVVITIYPASKVKDDPDPLPFDYVVTPSSLMEVVNWKTTVFTGSPARVSGEAVGVYVINGGTLALKEEGGYANNYLITDIQNSILNINEPGPVNISDPVGHMAPIIKYFHDTYDPIKFDLAAGPPDLEDSNIPPDPNDSSVKDIKYLGSFKFWYNIADRAVYYYYGGPVNLYGDCHNLFDGCYKFQTMNMRGFNTDHVTSMYQMFYLCYNVEHLDLSGWSFDNVTNVAHMFDRCEKLTKIDFSKGGVDLSKVQYMNWMFAHNFYMTPADLRDIIIQWKVKNNKGVVNTIFTDEFSNDTVDKLRQWNPDGPPDIRGANRIISNDMIKTKTYINNNRSPVYDPGDRPKPVPRSNGYDGDGDYPPSVAFGTDFAKYTTADDVELYLGNPSSAKGQRLNLEENH